MNTLPDPHYPALEDPATPEHARALINALGRIYLEAGLPLAAAFEAAVADYECTYEPLCLA